MNQTIKSFSLALVGTLLIVGCAPSVPQAEATPPVVAAPAELTDADKAKINETSKMFVDGINAGDMAATSMAYAEDAVVMPPGIAPIKGRKAIEEYFKSFPPVKNMTLKDEEVVGFGDYVYTRGRYSMTIIMPDKKEVLAAGSYLDVRKKQADGSWPYVVDTWTEDAPPAQKN